MTDVQRYRWTTYYIAFMVTLIFVMILLGWS